MAKSSPRDWVRDQAVIEAELALEAALRYVMIKELPK